MQDFSVFLWCGVDTFKGSSSNTAGHTNQWVTSCAVTPVTPILSSSITSPPLPVYNLGEVKVSLQCVSCLTNWNSSWLLCCWFFKRAHHLLALNSITPEHSHLTLQPFFSTFSAGCILYVINIKEGSARIQTQVTTLLLCAEPQVTTSLTRP